MRPASCSSPVHGITAVSLGGVLPSPSLLACNQRPELEPRVSSTWTTVEMAALCRSVIPSANFQHHNLRSPVSTANIPSLCLLCHLEQFLPSVFKLSCHKHLTHRRFHRFLLFLLHLGSFLVPWRFFLRSFFFSDFLLFLLTPLAGAVPLSATRDSSKTCAAATALANASLSAFDLSWWWLLLSSCLAELNFLAWRR